MALFGRLTSSIRIFSRSYRSPYAIDKLYPNSASGSKSPSNIPSKPAADSQDFNGYIPLDKVEVTYNSDDPMRIAQVRFNVKECDWIPTATRQTFFEKYQHRVDKEGYFVVRSDRTMSASLNVADCLDKLRFSIRECAAPPDVLKEDDDDAAKNRKEWIEEARKKQEIEVKKKLQVKRAAI